MKKYLLISLILFHQICFATYHSQCQQDKFVNENFFKNRKKGVFVDIGAHNGMTYSNTLFFEKELDWQGICVEPLPERFVELQQNRKCVCIQGCISDFDGFGQLLMVSSPFVNTEMLSGLLHKYDPRHLERVHIEIERFGGSYQIIDVKCYLFNKIMQENNITHIDFLSIDTEGGEYEILCSIDFSKYKIDVIAVEDNYKDPRFSSFLAQKGYILVTSLEQDLIFVHKDFKISGSFDIDR